MTIPAGIAPKPTIPQAIFADFSSLDALRESVSQTANNDGSGDNGALREAAQQFSSIFLHMALKSMRDASFGGGMLDTQQSEFYRDMFDQQIALDLSEGEGFGLTDVIVDQLTQQTESATSATTAADAAASYARVALAAAAQEKGSSADKEEATPDVRRYDIGIDRPGSSPAPGSTTRSRLALP